MLSQNETQQFIKANSTVDDSGCWLWNLSLHKKTGYPALNAERFGSSVAHKVSYLSFRGSIMGKHRLHHICGVNRCVNPDHLELHVYAEKIIKPRISKKIPKPSEEEVQTFIQKNTTKTLNNCWEWNLRRNPQGYGLCNHHKNYYSQLAHRMSYMVFKGPITGGLCVCHTCDNPPCCNPEHLWLGTLRDNAKDMVEKNGAAHLYGMLNGYAKLTDAQVFFIRNTNLSNKTLSNKFQVSAANIAMIRDHKTWKHL